MELNHRLYGLFQDKAAQVNVEILNLGLSYTCVTTSDGGMGVAFTWLDNGKMCCQALDGMRYEGRPADELLQTILDPHPLKRSMGLALINALNHAQALELPEDTDNGQLFDLVGVGPGSRVAMVGYFGPMMKAFEDRGAVLEIIDYNKNIGNPQEFYAKLGSWAEVLFLTSTSILNQSTEEILDRAPNAVRTVMLGPSTPMASNAFAHLPVDLLAGTVPVDQDKVLQAVRNGAGTRMIQKFSRKVHAELGPDR
jgi:hypothetical protein